MKKRIVFVGTIYGLTSRTRVGVFGSFGVIPNDPM